MCTAITMRTLQGDVLLGRTMDFSYPLEPELYLVPRGYTWSNALNTRRLQNQYSFLGIGQDIAPVSFADGVNEMGLAAAALYFPGYAQYDSLLAHNPGRVPIAAIELVHYLLGTCASVEQAASALRSIQIVGVKDAVTNSVAPLHWILADRKGACMTVEKTAEGLQLSDNPLGVLSNSPDFQWHMTNLRNYMNVAPYQYPDKEWGALRLSPFGQGGGSFGLPGDYTPPSRFVRAAYLKSFTKLPFALDEAVVSCFHLLESVSIPQGVVMTARGTSDYTQYTAFLNLAAQEYYFKTYQNGQIMTAQLPSNRPSGSKLVSLGKLKKPIVFGRPMN